MLSMELTLALFADYANVTKDGKLNLMGVFTIINAPALPWVHPQLQLVLQFEVGPDDWDTEKVIEVQLLDTDGNQLSAIRGNVKVTRPQVARPLQINSIMSINNLKFGKEGDYVFLIRLDGEIKRYIPLIVNYVPVPPAATKR